MFLQRFHYEKILIRLVMNDDQTSFQVEMYLQVWWEFFVEPQKENVEENN